jgi:NADH:ubiquinone oxidoreductase subunit K
MAIFLFVAGIGTLFIWMSELVEPLIGGQAPEILGPYTTLFTHGFDSAVITPAAVITGVFLLKRNPLGYLLAAPLMILCTLIGIVVIGQTVSQYLAGIIFPIGVYIGMIGSWVVMGAFAIALTAAYFRNLAST